MIKDMFELSLHEFENILNISNEARDVLMSLSKLEGSGSI